MALLVGACALLQSPSAAAQPGSPGDSSNTEDLTETIPPSEGDIVETIPPEQQGQSLAPVAPAQEALSDTRVQVSGYARQSLELVYGQLSRVSRNAADPQPPCAENPTPCLWQDAFISRTQLVLRASYLQAQHFEATVSGMLGYTLHAAEKAQLYSRGEIDLARGELDAQLREAYVGFFWPAVDLRIGQQRIAWGRSDFQSPNDVINARDLRDPFLSENELRYLPTPAIRASITGGVFTFEAVVSPFFIPDRFDVYGTNWGAMQRRAYTKYQEFLGESSLLVDQSIERELAPLFRQSERPLDNGKGTSAGARISAALPGVDLSAYYHYGYDSTPFVQIHPAFLQYVSGTTFTPGDLSTLEPALDLINTLGPGGPVSARYLRRHHVGFDLATTLGPIGLRLDAAYENRRVFYQVDFNSFQTPTLLGVLSLEYQTGNLDNIVLVELLAQHQLHDRPAEAQPLLAYERTTTAVAGTLRWMLGDQWGIDLRGLVGVMPKTYALQPALRYKPNDSFLLRLGALLLNGAENSFGWYYGDNDTAFVQLRYAF
ncbi:MAG TPA: DUF1302 family protein [Polyangiaceae bacterium]|nr:DUF1302 family protein [Polyangiaceae bacterium]